LSSFNLFKVKRVKTEPEDAENIPADREELLAKRAEFEKSLGDRLAELDPLAAGSKYEHQKAALVADFAKFLIFYKDDHDIMKATPHDVIAFLHYRGKNGVTKRHRRDCLYFGEHGKIPLHMPRPSLRKYHRQLHRQTTSVFQQNWQGRGMVSA